MADFREMCFGQNRHQLLAILFFSLLLFMMQANAAAQTANTPATTQPTPNDDKTLQILSTDLLEVIAKGNKPARKLIGNVMLQQGEVTMHCDSAMFYFEDNNIEAFGNIHIAQGDSVNIYSDRLLYNGNKQKATLYDRVKLNDKTTDIKADTLYYFVASKKAVLQNNVFMTDKKNDVYADKVEYFVNTKKAELYNNVRLTDGKVNITAQHMDYDVNSQEGTYSGGGKLVDGSTTLTSEKAHYYGATKKTVFEENVHLISPEYDLHTPLLNYDIRTETAEFSGQSSIKGKDGSTINTNSGVYDTKNDRLKLSQRTAVNNPPQTLIADDLDYNKVTGFGKARGNVLWTDTSQNVTIKSQAADFDDKNHTVLAYNRPVLINISGKDTLFLTADTLKGFTQPNKPKGAKPDAKQDTTRQKAFYAYRNVHIFRPDMQGICDSLVYSTTDSVFRMYYNPIIWSDNNQLYADTIIAYTKNNRLQQVHLIRSAFMATKEQEGVFNQVKAKNITGFFNDSTITHIFADGNAESIYYIKNEKQEYSGLNRAQSKQMYIYFKSKDIDRISFLDKPEATFYPIQQVHPADFILKGFQWQEKKRPQRPQLFLQ
ncbi:hypothetical protein C7N43_27530 [Sphingobacteriales bacterium UPWRP_1]|nr:hypothetical protein BVG80_05010 [Sphingobacteriales bacterium TSM_CSM]PSJ73754.1 hypothetical protein C7N43_27530 [Sphingobacteriales bacterium UPWRP_1]